MAQKSDLHVAQVVAVYSIHDNGRPPREGIVTRIGRTLVTIRILDGRFTFDWDFRIESQAGIDKMESQLWFRTEDPIVDNAARRQAALSSIGYDRVGEMTTKELECVAAALASMERDEDVSG